MTGLADRTITIWSAVVVALALLLASMPLVLFPDAGANDGAGPMTAIFGLPLVATAALIGHMSASPPALVDKELLDRFKALTPRERDVIVLVASGLSNDEIAAQLFVSPFTVKTHAVRAMTKVGARDRAQLVSFAFRAGLYP